jgi:hypothetical protein
MATHGVNMYKFTCNLCNKKVSYKNRLMHLESRVHRGDFECTKSLTLGDHFTKAELREGIDITLPPHTPLEDLLSRLKEEISTVRRNVLRCEETFDIICQIISTPVPTETPILAVVETLPASATAPIPSVVAPTETLISAPDNTESETPVLVTAKRNTRKRKNH